MKKQEYKFILGNGSEGEVIASSLSDALSSLSLGDQLKMQKRIIEEQGRKKRVDTGPATPQPVTTNAAEAFKPTAEQVAEFEKIMQRRAELDKKIKELEEEIKNDLEKKQTLAEVSPATADLVQLLGEDNVVASMNAMEEVVNENKERHLRPEEIAFYLSTPNVDGSFNESSSRKNFVEGASMFAFENIGNNRFNVHVSENEAAIKLALQYPDKNLDPVFEEISAYNPKAKLIKTIEPAIVELQNGKFVLMSKGTIDYVKEIENKGEVGKIEAWFTAPSGDKILLSSLTNDGGLNTCWGVENTGNNDYLVTKVSPKNEVGIIRRLESYIKPLFNEGNIAQKDSQKIIIARPAKLKKNPDGSFDIIDKGLVYYDEVPEKGSIAKLFDKENKLESKEVMFFSGKNNKILEGELSNSSGARFKVFNIKGNKAEYEYCGTPVNIDYFGNEIASFTNNPYLIENIKEIITVKPGIAMKNSEDKWEVQNPMEIKFI